MDFEWTKTIEKRQNLQYWAKILKFDFFYYSRKITAKREKSLKVP